MQKQKPSFEALLQRRKQTAFDYMKAHNLTPEKVLEQFEVANTNILYSVPNTFTFEPPQEIKVILTDAVVSELSEQTMSEVSKKEEQEISTSETQEINVVESTLKSYNKKKKKKESLTEESGDANNESSTEPSKE